MDLSRVLIVWLAEFRGQYQKDFSEALKSSDKSCKQDKESCLLQLGAAQATRDSACHPILIGVVGALGGFLVGVLLCVTIVWKWLVPLLIAAPVKGEVSLGDKGAIEVEAYPVTLPDEPPSSEVVAARRRARALPG